MEAVCHRILYKIAKEINSTLESKKVINAIVQSITDTLGAKGSSLMLLSHDGQELIHTVTYGLSDWYINKGPVRVDPAITEVLKGKTILISEVATDPRIQYKKEAKREGIISMLLVPFKLQDEVLGVLKLYLSSPRAFSEEIVEFLEAAASLGAIALDKARRYESKSRDLKAMTEQLNKLAEEKRRFMHFFNIAAHDLKAPLEAIQSYFWVILGGYAGELNPKPRAMIERSSKRLDELLLLISDLLDVSRVGIGRVLDDIEEVNLDKVVESNLEMAEDLARAKDITLIVEVPESIPLIQGSTLRFQQLISNLLSNAIKYSHKGGQVRFRIEIIKDIIKVEISDEGIGIPKEDAPYLFNEFFRARNVEDRDGTGLGLYIVKKIVDAHKGKIWVESPCPETGKGSKFTLILPRQISDIIRVKGSQRKKDKEMSV